MTTPPTMMRELANSTGQPQPRRNAVQRRPCTCGKEQIRICTCCARRQYVWKCRHCGKKER